MGSTHEVGFMGFFEKLLGLPWKGARFTTFFERGKKKD
jgi:hypothetical protein